MYRCENPLCNHLINRHRPHHKLGDAYFCSAECAKEWVDANESTSHVARRFLDELARQSSSSRAVWPTSRYAQERVKVLP